MLHAACRVHVLADNNCLSFLILSVYFQYSLSPHFGLLQNGQCEARDLVVHKESNHLCECNDSTKVAFPLRVVFLLPVYFYFFMHRNITWIRKDLVVEQNLEIHLSESVSWLLYPVAENHPELWFIIYES